MLQLVVDKNIPFIDELFSDIAKITYLPTSEINNNALYNADAALIRTPTIADEKLLKGTNIKFLGTASSGSNHLNKNWIEKSGIYWQSTPGSNAKAVAEYVISTIAYCIKQSFLDDTSLKIGIIGVGNVGATLKENLDSLGFETITNDPFRQATEPKFSHTELDDFKNLDVVTIHTPLTKDGPFPTYHLIGKEFLTQLKPGSVLINSSRGNVINPEELKSYGKHVKWCFDVWPNEPNLDTEIAKNCIVATPHIAGYTVKSKWNSTYRLYLEFCRFFNIEITHKKIFSTDEDEAEEWKEHYLNLYNPHVDNLMFKTLLGLPQNKLGRAFEKMRENYNLRSESNRKVC